MKINEESLKRWIGNKVTEQFLNEFSTGQGLANLSATRALTIEARKASLDFEKVLVKMLGLKEPDAMDAMSQRTYVAAMQVMEKRVLSAVLDAIKSVANLPKEEEEEDDVVGSRQQHQQVVVNGKPTAKTAAVAV